MKKMASDLTDEEQDEFFKLFYEDVSFNDCVEGNPNPWGCPWFHDKELIGNTVQEMVYNYIEDYKFDWAEFIEEEIVN